MQKKLFLILMVVGVLLIAAIAYVLATRMGSNDAESTETQQTAQEAPAEVAPEKVVTQPQPGTYKPYNEQVVSQTKGTKVLFFHAQWCPQCRQLDSEITAGPLPENVTIFKANYDNAQTLRQKYGVTLQTTFVKIDDNGNLVKKYVAYDEPTLAALIKNIL